MIGVQCERLRVASTGQGRRNLLRLRARAPQMRLKPQQGVSERGRGAPLGIGPRRHAWGRWATRYGPVTRSHPRKRGPCSTFHRPVTTQAPHLAQPKNISTLSRDRAIRADASVGSSLC